jgi:hypothetical protein
MMPRTHTLHAEGQDLAVRQHQLTDVFHTQGIVGPGQHVGHLVTVQTGDGQLPGLGKGIPPVQILPHALPDGGGVDGPGRRLD